MKIYLYLKTHNTTGLKYLGKTISDPHEYPGSGKIWKSHLKEYGNNVTTEILFETYSKEEFREIALKYSIEWNVVDSNEFANLTREEGQGGYTSYTKERNDKISNALKGRNNWWVTKGMNKGRVVAFNKKTGETTSVTCEEFDKNNNLVGICSINAGIPKSQEWKDSIKKRYKDNPRKGYKIQYKNDTYTSIKQLCAHLNIGKGTASGMIRRNEIIILEKYQYHK